MDHIAHIKNTGGLDNDSVVEEKVSEHCKKTALLARSYSAPLNMESTVFVSALLHDLGKLNYDFDGYIKHENSIKRGEIDHSYAGAKYLLELVSNDEDKYKKEVARLIARIIISHHGLNDWYTRNNDDYFDYRCSKNERYDEIKGNIGELVSDSDLDESLTKAADEYRRIFEKMKEICCAKDRKQYFTTLAFYHGLLERLTESCLIDADRTATAKFMEGIEITEPSEDEIQHKWLDMKQRMDNKLSKFSGSDSVVSKLRMNISDRCCAFAKNDVGIAQLIVPTGGGKTLSALRFAIEYAAEHKKERIFYVSPFMSILEQNGDVIREIAGDDNYLEHHSDMYCKIIDNKHKSKEEVADELEDYELRCRHWDKQVICTTMVQFFDTLFSSRTEALRRMHRFADSVIIIDEVQSIPIRCVYLFNLAMNFLSNFMGCTIVLCSATQPTFEQCKYPIMLDKDSSMTGDYTKDFEDFKRTEVVSLLNNQGNTYEEAAVICMDKYRENGNLLFVVNTKTAAAEIFRNVTQLNDEEEIKAKVVHLSTSMCPAHRRKAIDDIRRMLDNNERVICITTQLIEAGVDISFKCVIRSSAGLDNIAQAAGRCNRNGEDDCRKVYIIKLKDEYIAKLGKLKEAQHQCGLIVRKYGCEQLLSVDIMKRYFRDYYEDCARDSNGDMLEYQIRNSNYSILDLLSCNIIFSNDKGNWKSRQAFKTAGDNFRMIDNNTVDIIVPYNEEASGIIEALNGETTISQALELQRKAQQYIVSVYDYTFKKLAENDALNEIKVRQDEKVCIYALKKEFYNNATGLSTEGEPQEAMFV